MDTALNLPPASTPSQLTKPAGPKKRRIYKIREPRKPQRSNSGPELSETCSANRQIVRAVRRPHSTDTPVLPIEVDPTRVHLMQMLSAFLDVTFPTIQGKQNLEARGSFLMHLTDRDLATTPLLRYAMAMLSCGYLGVKTQDRELIHRSRESYGRTLHLLGRHVRGESQPYTSKDVITAMMMLTLPNDAIPSPEGVGDWMNHYEGAEAFVKARGSQSLDMSDESENLLLLNLRTPAVYIALSKRRLPILVPEPWMLKETVISPRVLLHLHGIAVAKAVAKTEACVRDPTPSSSELKTLWKELKDVGEWIHSTLTDESGYGRHVIKLERNPIHIDDSKAYDMEIEEHCFMTTNRTFQWFFRFHDDARGRYYFGQNIGQWWMYGLMVNCAQLRLLHYHPSLMRSALKAEYTESPVSDLTQGAFSYASKLCRSFHYFSTLNGQGDIDYLQLMCALAQNFFAEIGAHREFGWCQAMSIATRTRLHRLTRDQPRTLCRLRDLHGALSSLSKFRAPLARGGSPTQTIGVRCQYATGLCQR